MPEQTAPNPELTPKEIEAVKVTPDEIVAQNNARLEAVEAEKKVRAKARRLTEVKDGLATYSKDKGGTQTQVRKSMGDTMCDRIVANLTKELAELEAE